MTLDPKPIERIEALITALAKLQIGIEPDPDSDLGFRMFGYKDGQGTPEAFKLLAKDQDARVKSLTAAPVLATGEVVSLLDSTGMYGHTLQSVLGIIYATLTGMEVSLGDARGTLRLSNSETPDWEQQAGNHALVEGINQALTTAQNQLKHVVPTGDVDGVNTSFEIPEAPANWANVFCGIDGAVRRPGVDFTGSGTTITTDFPPNTRIDFWYSLPEASTLPTEQVITSATGTVEADKDIVIIDYAGAVTITIPTTIIAANGKLVEFFDRSGNAAVNNITIAGEGGEEISGDASGVAIVSNGLNNSGASVTIRMRGTYATVVGSAL